MSHGRPHLGDRPRLQWPTSLPIFNLPPQEEKLVITTAGVVQLGELLAQSWLVRR